MSGRRKRTGLSHLDQAVVALLPPELQVLAGTSTQVAALWSSYGHIYRFAVLKNDMETSLILKHIHPPHAEHASVSHVRKLLSYSVERFFYERLASQLPATVTVAKHHTTRVPGTLLLDDLTSAFPRPASGSLGLNDTHAVLRWLAAFHATFWGQHGTVPPPVAGQSAGVEVDVAGVWQQGTYWYLDTRREELADVGDHSDGGVVLPWVDQINAALASERAAGRCTLLHGDAKGENIMFAPDGRCAFVDFQYVGSGPPTLDLAYFLGTSVQSRLMQGDDERQMLRFYFDALSEHLPSSVVYSWDTFSHHWELALVDWCRFMAGWGFWGNDRWVIRRAREVVQGWTQRGFPDLS